MKVTYTLQGSKRVIVIGNSQVVLNKGENEIQISSQVFTKIKQDLDRYTSLGILEYEATEENIDNKVQYDQKILKQSLLKQCKDCGIPVTNTMTVEVLQGLLDKYKEQIKPYDNHSQPQDDNAGNDPSNS